MDKFKSLPFWLLLSYLVFTMITGTQYANSIIVVALSALFGFELFIKSRTFKSIESEEVRRLKNELDVVKITENIKLITSEDYKNQFKNLNGQHQKGSW